MPPITEADEQQLDRELSGLDALELAPAPRAEWASRLWAATWPKLLAVAIALLLWQLVVWSGWKKPWQLPPPGPVFRALWDGLQDGTIWKGIGLTLRRAVYGYSLALVIGVAVGLLVARSRVLRSGVGSMITGLMTMPSIAWFPLAIVLLGGNESAIMFVVVLGAAPAIANGLIAGIDNVPPILVRAGRVLGARGTNLWRHVVLPAAMPTFAGGLKQGWAFAWRSLLAGELIVIVRGTPSLGAQLSNARDLREMELLLAIMIVILVIGILADSLVFGRIERAVRKRFGLVDAAGS
jgi:NitT/TauT family transport system permease protein